MNDPIGLSTFVYPLAINRCAAIIKQQGITLREITDTEFNFASNGCVHCSLGGVSEGGLRVRADVKLDCKPEPHYTGPMLSTADEPTVFIIREDITVDGVYTEIYENPSYND